MNKEVAIEILSQIKSLSENLKKTGMFSTTDDLTLGNIKDLVEKRLGKMTFNDSVKKNEKHL